MGLRDGSHTLVDQEERLMTKETNQTLRHRFRGGDCGCRPFLDSVLVGAGGSSHSQWERAAAAPGSDAQPGSGPGSRSGPGPVWPRATMEAWVRFSAQSQARERLLRAAQYACALAGAALIRAGNGSGGSSGTLSRLQHLEAHLSLGRKLLRLGGSAEALGGAQRSLHLPDPVLRFCLTLSHLNRALFLACDNVLWAGKTGILPGLDTDKWSQRSFRYYLFALVVNLSRDAYEIRVLLERTEVARKRGKSPENRPQLQADGRIQRLRLHLQFQLQLLLQVLRDNPPLLLDLLRNACDLMIPLEKLGLCRSSPGIVAFCGLTSSVLSILTILHPWLKLKP